MESKVGKRAMVRKNTRIRIVRKIIILVCLIIFAIATILFCKSLFSNNKDSLFGVWNVDGNTKYEFDGNGKGKVIVPLNEYKFVYTINENELFIDFENESSIDSIYIYSIKKDKLVLQNIKDNSLKFELQKLKNEIK